MAIIDADVARHTIVSNHPSLREEYRQKLHKKINSTIAESNSVHNIKVEVGSAPASREYRVEHYAAVGEVILDLKLAGYIDVELIGDHLHFRCVKSNSLRW